MKDRLFWIPTLIILATPIVVAVVCMVLEVRWKTWIALASGVEPTAPDEPTPSRAARTNSNRSFGRRERLGCGPGSRFEARVCNRHGQFSR